MARDFEYACVDCTWKDTSFRYQCPRCAGVVVVDAAPLPGPPERDPAGAGIWRWSALIPATTAKISLGEANTPLIPWPSRAGTMLLKLETQNPTLSFKDRAMALASSFAVDGGYYGLVVASTGNAAASASAYAARAGLRCRVIVGSGSNAAAKLRVCRAYGAEIVEVEGDYSVAYAAALTAEQDGWLNVSTTYRNPVPAEAYRSIAFELAEQLGQPPAAVCVPIGAGPLLRGIERGFSDLTTIDGSPRPRMIGVQARAVAPIVAAWKQSHGQREAWSHSLQQASPWEPTIATAIADPLRGYERQGELTLASIRASGGAAIAVTEDDIIDATERLRTAGFWVEPSSATALVAAERSIGSTRGPVVAVLTGHGIKVVD